MGSVHSRKSEALAAGRDCAKRDHVDLIVHRKDAGRHSMPRFIAVAMVVLAAVVSYPARAEVLISGSQAR